MTVELDKLIKTLKGRQIRIELYKEGENSMMFIDAETSTGCEYKVQSLEDVVEIFKGFIEVGSEY